MATEACVTKKAKGLSIFERYLTLWVLLCIVVGIALLLSGFGFVVLAVGGALRAGGWLFARQEKAAAAKKSAPISA